MYTSAQTLTRHKVSVQGTPIDQSCGAWVRFDQAQSVICGLENMQVKYRAALALCLQEISQFHAMAYPDCNGGCPAHEAINAAKTALGSI